MTLSAGYTLRPAGVPDAALIQAQRTAMFTEMGSDVAGLARVHEAGVAWHRRMLASGAYTGFLIESGGEVVAGAGLLWNDFPPNADTDSLVRAYLLNVYVDPEHRGHALARRLVEAALDECRARGVNIVTLTASDAGRPTYERLGFVPQAELKLLIPEVTA
ncbi:GNAT family N-acetyltransferase [Deinococcus sp. KSM4-11]|uniref:GNAT family N-acetyltransferase n=1 Tax=Deinococcus sp. KSM4-11 TaxID=2568654 RepID=UPI001F0D381B|nr:GNAT family N-acetyltransferase [Deinococcus sp. KSM4-11]